MRVVVVVELDAAQGCFVARAQIEGFGQGEDRRERIVVLNGEVLRQERNLLACRIEQLGLAQGVNDDDAKALIELVDCIALDQHRDSHRGLTCAKGDSARRNGVACKVAGIHTVARIDFVGQADHALDVA